MTKISVPRQLTFWSEQRYLFNDIEELSATKMEDQKTFLRLQNQLTEKDSDVRAVQSTVQTELKTYSSALTSDELTKTCAAALVPKRISENKKRGKIIIICGMNEGSYGDPTRGGIVNYQDH